MAQRGADGLEHTRHFGWYLHDDDAHDHRAITPIANDAERMFTTSTEE